MKLKIRLFEKNSHPLTWTPITPRKKIFIQKKMYGRLFRSWATRIS
jgi:hypothetical protein